MDLDEAKTRAQQVIDTAAGDLRSLSLSIHAQPELCFEEHHAHAVLTDYLESRGFQVDRGAFEMATAFQAVAGSGSPTIAVLCEYDALPGIGHACGHNLIAVAGAGAALALKETLAPGEGTVVVLGSPAEEGGGGKILLIERGAFEGVDAAMMAHPTSRDSAYMHVLAVDHVNVEYRGRNAHAAAAPWEGVNALDALVLAYSSISAMRQQMLPSDRVHGVITHGGLKPNIIPDYTAAEFYIRSRNRAELEVLRAKVMGCFEGAAKATGCELAVTTSPDQRAYSDMVASDTLAGLYTENLATFGVSLPAKHQVLAGPGGSTDMGDVSYVVPSIHPMFAIPTDAGNHTPGFTAAAATPEAHAAAMRAAKAMAMTALDAYHRPAVVEAAQKEFASIVAR